MAKKHVTFNLEEEVKKEFNLTCVKHGLNMSETVENLMINFVVSCVKMEEEQKEVKLKMDNNFD